MAEVKRARGVPEEWVEIEHDGIEATTKVAPQAVSHWEARGWKAVTAAPVVTPAAKTVAKTGSES